MLESVPNWVILVAAIALLAVANGRQLVSLAAPVSAWVRQWFVSRPLPHPTEDAYADQLEKLLSVRAWALQSGRTQLAESVNESLRILLEVSDS